jgi:hypothetical protein
VEYRPRLDEGDPFYQDDPSFWFFPEAGRFSDSNRRRIEQKG